MYHEWTRLNKLIVHDEVLRALPLQLHELYSRLFLHFGRFHHNVLLLVAVVQALAIDATISNSSDRVLRALRAEDQDYKSEMLLYMLGRAWQAMGPRIDARAIAVKTLLLF